jgi:hypothetical protein
MIYLKQTITKWSSRKGSRRIKNNWLNKASLIKTGIKSLLELLGSRPSRALLLALARLWCCCFFGFGMRYLEIVGFPRSWSWSFGIETWSLLLSTMTNCMESARILREGLLCTGRFDIISKEKGVPLVTFSFKDKYSHNSAFKMETLLRRYGWIVPAYTMPANLEHMTVLRALLSGKILADPWQRGFCHMRP